MLEEPLGSSYVLIVCDQKNGTDPYGGSRGICHKLPQEAKTQQERIGLQKLPPDRAGLGVHHKTPKQYWCRSITVAINSGNRLPHHNEASLPCILQQLPGFHIFFRQNFQVARDEHSCSWPAKTLMAKESGVNSWPELRLQLTQLRVSCSKTARLRLKTEGSKRLQTASIAPSKMLSKCEPWQQP